MISSLNEMVEYTSVDRQIFQNEIIPAYKPVVIRGAFKAWPLVQKAVMSPAELIRYLLQYDTQSEVEIFTAAPELGGHFLYEKNIKSFNFQKAKVPFGQCLGELLNNLDNESSPTLYMGSTVANKCAPGLMTQNLCHLVAPETQPRLWIGNATLVQPHFDVSSNLAIVVGGRRKFTLFPPAQIDNLYIGPLDVTPAGQPMSIVSLLNPDLEKYPRYQFALEASMTAILEPGDAIFIPPLWWHGVQALDRFNMLVNYWWQHTGYGKDSAYDAMVHGMLAIRSLPEADRQAWSHYFKHYIFQGNGHPLKNFPSAAHGVLSEMSPALYQVMRSYLLKKLTNS